MSGCQLGEFLQGLEMQSSEARNGRAQACFSGDGMKTKTAWIDAEIDLIVVNLNQGRHNVSWRISRTMVSPCSVSTCLSKRFLRCDRSISSLGTSRKTHREFQERTLEWASMAHRAVQGLGGMTSPVPCIWSMKRPQTCYHPPQPKTGRGAQLYPRPYRCARPVLHQRLSGCRAYTLEIR